LSVRNIPDAKLTTAISRSNLGNGLVAKVVSNLNAVTARPDKPMAKSIGPHGCLLVSSAMKEVSVPTIAA
jgi:hypothetical protein